MNRPCGYKDHGSMSEVGTRARRQADTIGYQDREVLEAFYEARADDYIRAAEILEMERQGMSAEEVQAQQGAGILPSAEERIDPCLHPSRIRELLEEVGVVVQPEELPSEALERSRSALRQLSLTEKGRV